MKDFKKFLLEAQGQNDPDIQEEEGRSQSQPTKKTMVDLLTTSIKIPDEFKKLDTTIDGQSISLELEDNKKYDIKLFYVNEPDTIIDMTGVYKKENDIIFFNTLVSSNDTFNGGNLKLGKSEYVFTDGGDTYQVIKNGNETDVEVEFKSIEPAGSTQAQSGTSQSTQSQGDQAWSNETSETKLKDLLRQWTNKVDEFKSDVESSEYKTAAKNVKGITKKLCGISLSYYKVKKVNKINKILNTNDLNSVVPKLVDLVKNVKDGLKIKYIGAIAFQICNNNPAYKQDDIKKFFDEIRKLNFSEEDKKIIDEIGVLAGKEALRNEQSHPTNPTPTPTPAPTPATPTPAPTPAQTPAQTPTT